MPNVSPVIVGRGPRAIEERLVADVLELAAAGVRDLGLLSRPVRVVVPSRSLREHVSATLVRAAGRALAGVVVETLHAVAVGVAEPAREGEELLPILVRRFSANEEALAEVAGAGNGLDAVVAAVRDLLDAGFDGSHLDALEERLAAIPARSAHEAELERALAVARVAAQVVASDAVVGARRRARLYREAALRLAEQPERLPSRAVMVVGFADATGVAGELIASLMRLRAARFYVDRPSDPGRVEMEDPAAGFVDRLVQRVAPGRAPAAHAVAPPRVELVSATGTDGEVRAVAERIRRQLDDGESPESIGVVARDLGPYASAIRRHFGRLGVPFSGIGATVPDAVRRRFGVALEELLERGGQARTESWLALLPKGVLGRGANELALALRALGCARLVDVAALDLDAILAETAFYRLPLRRGLARIEDDGEAEARVVAPRAAVHGDRLRAIRTRARRTLARLEAWPPAASLEAHLSRTKDLLRRDLGWRRSDVPGGELALRLDDLRGRLPSDLTLDREGLRLLVRERLVAWARARIGGAGGGVQVLGVGEARGRTFARLYVLGLERGVFPRVIHEDPLLSDSLRQALADVLPDIPIKRRGIEEERYLFASLVAAGLNVALSWREAGDEGEERPVSPFVERIEPGVGESARVEHMADPLARPDAILTANEAARAAGLAGSRARFRDLLPEAIAESLHQEGRADESAAPRAAALARILDERDPERAGEGRLGPYFGHVGPLEARTLAVTEIERLARCPWQTFLERILRIEPTPDPLEELPGPSPIVVGNLVHAVLETIVREGVEGELPKTLDDALARVPARPPWPQASELERIVSAAAAKALREAGIVLPGMGRITAARAKTLLETAHQLDWSEDAPPVVGVEVEGRVEVEATSVEFRADRVDRTSRGPLLVDYKTGVLREGARKLAERARQGERLQAVAYALASGGRGRYLHLGELGDTKGLDEDDRRQDIDAEDEDVRRAFANVVSAVTALRAKGTLFPRLVDPDEAREFEGCRWCRVIDACSQQDSEARRRLFAAFATDDGSPEHAVWALRKKPKRR